MYVDDYSEIFQGQRGDYYAFRVNEMLAGMRIDFTAAENYESNINQYDIVWKPGDTVILSTPVYTSDSESKYLEQVNVFGLFYQDIKIVDPYVVESIDRKRITRWYIVSGTILSIGLILWIYRKFKTWQTSEDP